MKKILSLLIVLLASVTTTFAAEKTVWEGSQQISWNNDYYSGTQLDTYNVDEFKTIFTGVAKDDVIHFYTTSTYSESEIQYAFKYKAGSDWSWTDLTTSISDGVVSYTVESEEIATWIVERGLVITGQAYTLTKITIETPESDGDKGVIWTGSTALDWGADPAVNVSLAAEKFTNAEAGDVLKIEGTADEWIQVQVCVNYPWKSSDSYTALPISYTIAEEDLENIKANGMTISGQYATITKVTLTTAGEDITQYTLTMTQPADGTGSIQINGVDATTQQYDENTVLELVAVPIANYQFDQWISTTEGIINEDNKSVSPLSVTMDKDIDISAAFSVVNGKILDWKHEYASNGDYDLSSVKAGDIVRITFVQTSEDGGEMYLKVSAKDESWGYSPTFHDGVISTTTYDIEVTEDYQTNIAARGLFLQGNNITITNIEIVAAEPEPATPVFDENGKADLAKFVADDGVNYENGVITVGESAWKGVSLMIPEEEQVNATKLTVKFAEAAPAYVHITYTDDEGWVTDDAHQLSATTAELVMPLDYSKKVSAIHIQLTEANTSATLTEVSVSSKYMLTVIADYGSVTVKKGEEDVTGVTEFAVDTELTLTATANEGYLFSKWTDGTNDLVANDDKSLTITMNGDKTITAVFVSSFTPDSDEEIVLSTETKALGTDWGGYVQVATSVAIPSTAKAGDMIKVYVKDVNIDGGNWQLKTNADGWPLLSETSSGTVTNADKSYSYTLTLSNIEALKTNDLLVTGINYTVVGVTYVVGEVLTPVFDENGKADLNKFVADDGVNYENGVITVGESAWKGVSLMIPEEEQVNATKLTVKFAETAPAYVHVTYADEEGWIADDAHQLSATTAELVMPLDYSKKVSAIHIQLTEANTTATLTEVSVSSKCMLTVNADHGTVKVMQGETDVTGTTEFDYGTALTLTVTPESDAYIFKYWQIGDATSTDNPYTLTMNGNVTITAVFGYADENLLWKGTKAITWSDALEIQSDVVLDIADQLVMEVETTIPESDWPQLQLRSLASGQPTLNGASGTPLKSATTTVTYYLTKLMLSDITANGGFVVAGNGYTLKSVRKVAGTGATGYENSVWIGNTTFDDSWTGNQPVAASCFANVKVGDYLRVKVKNLGVSPVMTLSYDNEGWKQLPDTEANKPVKGGYVQYTITADMLAALQAYGMIITGTNFTLTSIDILDPSMVKVLNQWVDVENNWIFTSQPTITIKVENPNNEVVTANAELVVTTDKLGAVTTLTKSVDVAAKGTVDIPMTFDTDLAAGFYKATAMVNGDLARAFVFGVNPTQIVSAPDKQQDFEQFWADAKTQLDAIPVNAKLTKIPAKSGSKRTVYLVEMQSIPDGQSGDPVTIRGYYAEPSDGKRHPVKVHYQGYDSEYRPGGDSATPWCIDASSDTDESARYAEFILSTRGQSVNNRKASERVDGIDEDFTNTYGDWFAFNFGNKDGYYYRGAYMDCVRALDFLATRSTSDMDNLFAEGQSQGGAFTYAAAALSGYTFKAIAPAITFMGDFPDYFQIVSWPGNVAKANQGDMTDDEMYAFLSYFDTKNLATMVSCPVITSIGIQDNVCPPHTNIAPYNNVLTAEENKQVIYNAELQHATNANWNSDLMAFFEKYRTESQQDPEPEPGEKTRTENAQKLLDVLTSLYGNKIISGTTAVVDWNTSQAEQVHLWTNKYPAINTYDFINIHASKDVNPEGWLDYSDISGVKNWAAEGGVVSAMWHWQVKNNAGTGYTCTPGTGDAATSFDASKVYVDGTAENTLAKQQLSQICGYLKKMQAAGIPVIWRPLHEAAGNTCEFDGGTAWFWWGAKGADVYKQLWQWMYNYMVKEQGLYNLIWVWTSQTKDNSWYPGDDYVDIIGRDIYSGEAAQHKSNFDHLSAGYTNMMVALSECGNTNDASQSDISAVWDAGAKWSWFSTWYDTANSNLHNTQSWWTNAFSQDYVVTRDQMKELLDLKIEPDPEPQPEPDTNTFDENGIADLSKIEVQDAEKVTYDVETHTVTTTAGWTGVQLTIADGEQVSGKELRITFDRAIKVKCYVKYMDETDDDVIMDDAAEILYFELDNTKKLYQVQIQPTETATFAFNEICVNAESTKPVLKPLEEGETRILFEDEVGIVMNWNEICQMAAEWGAILEAGENFLVTVKSRTEGSEWPKVILRDASSTAVNEVELADVTDYPHIVKIKLTDTMINQLKDGFRFSGDGVTITKIELNKPAPAKDGDISVEAMNWFRTSLYDADAFIVTTTARWGQAGWAIGDDRYAEKTLIIVNIEPTSFPVTLKVEYINTDDKTLANSVGIDAGNTELYLPIPLDTKTIKKVYVTYREAGSIVLTDASIITAANARPLTGNEGATDINTLDNLINSQVDNAPIYNLSGQRVDIVGKGVYIQNGKKKVIK